MTGRPYDEFAAGLRAEWRADVHEVRDELAAQLEAEVAERVSHRHVDPGRLDVSSSVESPVRPGFDASCFNGLADELEDEAIRDSLDARDHPLTRTSSARAINSSRDFGIR